MLEEYTFHLSDYLDILRRRKDTVIVFFAITVLLVTIGTLLMTPTYRATAVLLIDLESPQVLATGQDVKLHSEGISRSFAYQDYLNSQIEIIVSKSIAQRVFDEFNLASFEGYQKTKEPLKLFQKTILVEPIEDSRLIELSVDNEDPVLAAKIVNFIADTYITRNLAYISKSERMNLLKNEYLALEAIFSEYSKKYKPKHPEYIRISQELAEVAEQIEIEKNPAPIGSEIEEFKLGTRAQRALGTLKANNVSVVDYASIPKTPYKPKRLLNLIIAIGVGLFGGIGVAFFNEYQDATIKDMEDVIKFTSWTYLGRVPVIPGSKKEFHVHKTTKDHTTEAYRSISTKIFLAGSHDNPLKSIAISSLGQQEGKTTTLCNLGIVLAQNKRKVLLVDTDMHKPRLHNVFKSKHDKGLRSYLEEQADYKEVVQKTEIENLFLIADAKPSFNPSVLLASDKMREFVDVVKQDYDYVLYDTPPIGGIADATILSQLVDGIILVMESGKTPIKAVIRNHRILSDSRVKCAGVIIIKAPVSGSESYYYHYKYT
jgi:capsular exopolysaccharide synthesis family protein